MMTCRTGTRGQYLLEWALLFTAVVFAVGVMGYFVKDSLAAKVKGTEMQLNGAMRDNRP